MTDQQPQPPHERTWQMWLLARARPFAFAIAMLIILIFVLLFGGEKAKGDVLSAITTKNLAGQHEILK